VTAQFFCQRLANQAFSTYYDYTHFRLCFQIC
jgi:hypothetical protein